MVNFALFSAGLLALVFGSELLVRGASRLAALLGLSPLVIGLTVVSIGTSAPEIAVSVESAWRGVTDLTVGNVVGSNIFNVLAILGLSALFIPLSVHSQIIRQEIPRFNYGGGSPSALWDGRACCANRGTAFIARTGGLPCFSRSSGKKGWQ